MTGTAASGFERRPWWRRLSRRTVRILVVVVVCLPVFVATASLSGAGLLLFGDLPGTVPDPKPKLESIPSVVYAADGSVIGEFREFDLTRPMTQADVPQVLKDAVIAAEDNSFWEHQGFDPEGLARSALANYREGETVQGGSTITQQLIRERYLTRERSVERKLNEIILATRFERDLAAELGSVQAAKEQILFEYLDTVYLGGGAYGAAAASETYFRKPVAELTISEAALLASVIPAPSDYGPRDNPLVAEGRRQQVLKRMLELRLISQAEFDEAFAQAMWLTPFGPPPGPATLVYPPPQAANSSDPYFVDYVRTYVSERYGPEMLYRGGLQIHATLDPRLQAEAQASVDRALAGTGDPLEMSLVSVEPRTGFVRALIGGRDFDVSQVNLALGGTTGMQPGSAFKTFTVAKALEEGYGPDTVYPAPSVLYVPGCGGQCAINGGTGGAIDMAQATSGSVNTYFAQLILDVGPNDVAELANRVGVTRITPDREYNLGLTLGAFEVSPLDMAAGYATIANHGVRAEATPVAYIVVPDGSVLEDNRGPRGTPVLNPAVADWTTQLLRGVVDGGTGKRAAFGRPAAGKTGTAQSNKAAWFVGYTPQLATAVWMGYRDEPRPLRGIGGFGEVYGGTLPAITWQRFMAAAHEPWPVEDFALPGPLPAPSSEIRRVPREAGIPTLPRDCGGPCYSIPVITAPTTTVPPPPEPDPAAPVDVAEGTLPEEPGAGGDIGPAQEPAG